MLTFELEVIESTFKCIVNDKIIEFDSYDSFAKTDYAKRYVVKKIWAEDSNIYVEIKPVEAARYDLTEEWVKKYKEQFNEEPSFF